MKFIRMINQNMSTSTPKTSEVNLLEKKAAEIRLKSLLTMRKTGKEGMGGDMSSIEILTALYYGTLNREPIVRLDPKKPGWDGQDYVLISKKHGVISQYSILADLGFFDEEELNFVSCPGSLLSGRPNMKVPGIKGTLLTSGHGLSVGLGISLGLNMDKADNKVFMLADVSELQSGQFWEAALCAAHYKLSNLILIIDDSKLQNDGPVNSVIEVGSVQNKFDSFGWSVQQIMNGHDFDSLLNVFLRAFNVIRKPVCIWCHTVSGKGITFAERKHGYFNAKVSEPELDAIIPNLKEQL
ncbi:transketolase [Candidatus Peregrinibacteria bacterium]|nr:transketolase [Candidatus Peregrinibacteria bacterium]